MQSFENIFIMPPNLLTVSLINKLTAAQVRNASFVIYAHQCDGGVYVGFCNDVVTRWNTHFSDAFNVKSREYQSPFRCAIRKYDHFRHFIIAVANTEEEARQIEAEAIREYGTLNVRNEERCLTGRTCEFGPLSRVNDQMDIRSKRNINNESRSDDDRQLALAKIVFHHGRKRLLSIKNEFFPAGLRVECPRPARDPFDEGDIVSFLAALSERKGKQYLVTSKQVRFEKVG
ncbi:hypothetical protein GCM10023116_32230 [Kistimonas scapharcae]|uniref:GIY-YIG domain-containing protein n=1 Tax=Kistimonas scapharcae TaxID=1036133 RepID=A0ABP8V4E9_9GAMM